MEEKEELKEPYKRIRFLEDFVKADIPYIFLKTPSETHTVLEFVHYCSDDILIDYSIYQWDCADGLKRLEFGDNRKFFKKVNQKEFTNLIREDAESTSPEAFLKWVNRKIETEFNSSAYKPFIIFSHNLHLFMEEAFILQYLKNLKTKFLACKHPPVLIALSSKGSLNKELESEFVYIDMGKNYRTKESISVFLSEYLIDRGVTIPEEDFEKIVENSVGLDIFECETIYSISFQRKGKLDPNDVLKEKINLINKYAFLEYVKHSITEKDVGGLENFKNWIKKRKILFKEKPVGLKPPKGVLLLGVPGTGKSLSAKYVSSVLEVPLIRVDVGQLFNKWVGETEANVQKMISVVESIGACVLWFDEIEKSLSPKVSSGDSGVSRRVFSRILTWFQEKTLPIFIFATANRVEELPPEFIRKGRFDEIFFVDIPNREERFQIFKVYLKEMLREEDIDYLASISEGFVGSDIEYIVEEAKLTAFQEKTDISVELIEEIMKSVPRSSENLDIQAIRKMCLGRFRPASYVSSYLSS